DVEDDVAAVLRRGPLEHPASGVGRGEVGAERAVVSVLHAAAVRRDGDALAGSTQLARLLPGRLARGVADGELEPGAQHARAGQLDGDAPRRAGRVARLQPQQPDGALAAVRLVILVARVAGRLAEAARVRGRRAGPVGRRP